VAEVDPIKYVSMKEIPYPYKEGGDYCFAELASNSCCYFYYCHLH